MGETTGIAWTDATFNCWVGCSKVSAECDNCYAESGSKRLAAQHGLKLWEDDRYFTSEDYWKKPSAWNRAAQREGRRRRVFCASFSDVFEDRPELVDRRIRLLHLIEGTPWLDWQLLTKRPENMIRLASPVWPDRWPTNAWAGTTVGVRASLPRVDHLLKVPASIHFVSMEPLLEPRVDLTEIEMEDGWAMNALRENAFRAPVSEGHPEYARLRPHPAIDWVIVGGESGAHARPFDLQWARRIKMQCYEHGVAFFFKQAGSHVVDSGGGLDLRGRPYRLDLKDKKGGKLGELPLELRVRDFPEVRT